MRAASSSWRSRRGAPPRIPTRARFHRRVTRRPDEHRRRQRRQRRPSHRLARQAHEARRRHLRWPAVALRRPRSRFNAERPLATSAAMTASATPSRRAKGPARHAALLRWTGGLHRREDLLRRHAGKPDVPRYRRVRRAVGMRRARRRAVLPLPRRFRLRPSAEVQAVGLRAGRQSLRERERAMSYRR